MLLAKMEREKCHLQKLLNDFVKFKYLQDFLDFVQIFYLIIFEDLKTITYPRGGDSYAHDVCFRGVYFHGGGVRDW